MHSSHEALRHRPQKGLKRAGIIALAIAVTIVAAGLISRGLASRQLAQQTVADATPVVDVISPKTTRQDDGLTLPGQVQADDNAVIHARVSGYLKHWYVDIGAQVKTGQLLADIDTPELDQQLEQAKANMATAAANQGLAKTTAERWTNLLARDAVSKQETDEKTGDYAAKTALVQAAKAEVDRLNALESFKRIVAPFDGVVTARNTDIGQLIAAGNPADPGLFTVAKVKRLRIYVHVPQAYSAQIKVGQTAELSVPEYPGRTFQAKVATTSGAIGVQSGAVLVELQMDNADNALKPGEYTQVAFALPPEKGVVRLPASALLLRPGGMTVAVLDPQGYVRLKTVKVQRDMGSTVEIASGVDGSDRVINNPPDSLEDGEPVRLSQPASASTSKQEG
ncbi:MAG TPA: efflux RND transporter periplasmic adaptor subunit [Caulobacteraceae bacterium]|nr:efflux RND transporter periplasmic adaptor subunit [Caulobacteraceae bacterium]